LPEHFSQWPLDLFLRLGSASAWFRNAHIVINIIPRRLSGRPQLLLQLVSEVLTGIFVLCVFFGSIAIMIIQYPAKTTALEISISYFYLGLFVGITGIVIFHARLVKQTISRLARLGFAENKEP